MKRKKERLKNGETQLENALHQGLGVLDLILVCTLY